MTGPTTRAGTPAVSMRFDTMAGPDRELDAAVPLVTGLADAALSRVPRPGR